MGTHAQELWPIRTSVSMKTSTTSDFELIFIFLPRRFNQKFKSLHRMWPLEYRWRSSYVFRSSQIKAEFICFTVNAIHATEHDFKTAIFCFIFCCEIDLLKRLIYLKGAWITTRKLFPQGYLYTIVQQWVITH